MGFPSRLTAPASLEALLNQQHNLEAAIASIL